MFDCIFIKKKLYDYQDNSLSDRERFKVKAHLERCTDCSGILQGMRNVVRTAEDKTIPMPSEDFWRHFKIGLDEKLNERLVKPTGFSFAAQYRLKPVLIPSLVALVLVFSSFWYFNRGKLVNRVEMALVNEIALWEELSPGTSMTNGEEMGLDELVNFDVS